MADKPRLGDKVRDNKAYPKPSGPEVEWYLGASDQYKKGERMPYSINGYNGYVTVGARNKTPKEVMELFQSCASRTKVVDVERYDPSHFGVPRRSEDFFNPQYKVIEQKDWDVEQIGESSV